MSHLHRNHIAHLFKQALDPSLHISGVCVDTKILQPGNLFIALKGDRVDGHDFLQEAAETGASAAIVDEKHSQINCQLPLIRVSDTLEALQKLAQAALKETDAQ